MGVRPFVIWNWIPESGHFNSRGFDLNHWTNASREEEEDDEILSLLLNEYVN